MIVRDEGGQLAECLAGVRDLADEVCVVDTGSTDDTVALAVKAGAKVSHFTWCDDFAAARNASLGACTGDWIFVLDADERLDSSAGRVFRELAGGAMDRCYRFLTRNYTDDFGAGELHSCGPQDPYSRGYLYWVPSLKIRFFPNRPDLRFDGKVHELVNSSAIRAGLDIEECPLVVHHYPLTQGPERVQSKRLLYVKLCLAKIEAAPADAKGYAELGNQYAELGDYAAAAAAYRDSLKRKPDNGAVLKDLGGTLFLIGRKAEAEKALRIAVSLDPDLPDGWRNLGVLCSEAENWEEAVSCFQRTVDLRPGWSEGLRYLGVALEKSGQLEAAVAISHDALEANPASAECLSLYVNQMVALGRGAQGRETLAALSRSIGATSAFENARGELCVADGLTVEAREAFEKSLALDAGNDDARRNLAVLAEAR